MPPGSQTQPEPPAGEATSRDPQIETGVTRRGFFRALVREAQVLAGLLEGKQGYTLAGLPGLPDEQMARLIPGINPAFAIELAEGYAWARLKSTGQAVRLFPLELENTAAFNLFNGRTPLGEAGRLLSEQLGWDEVRAFAHLRALFLELVRSMVCLPTNSLGELPGDAP